MQSSAKRSYSDLYGPSLAAHTSPRPNELSGAVTLLMKLSGLCPLLVSSRREDGSLMMNPWAAKPAPSKVFSVLHRSSTQRCSASAHFYETRMCSASARLRPAVTLHGQSASVLEVASQQATVSWSPGPARRFERYRWPAECFSFWNCGERSKSRAYLIIKEIERCIVERLEKNAEMREKSWKP